MDISEEVTNQEYDGIVPLEEFVNVEDKPISPVSESTIRNRSATLALISQSSQQSPIQTYQNLIGEAERGKSDYYNQLNDQLYNELRAKEMKPVIQVLADPNLSPERKKAIIEGINNDPFSKKHEVLLQEKALIAPSGGETEKQEKARIYLADILRNMDNSREEAQKRVNIAAAKLDDAGVKTFFEAAELMIPFMENLSVAKTGAAFRKELGVPDSPWAWIKDFVAPGSAQKGWSELIESVPSERRAEFTQKLLNAINKDGVGSAIFSNSQYARMDRMRSQFEEDGYSDTEKWMSNVFSLLDFVGLGGIVKRSLKTVKGAAKAEKGAEAVIGSVKAEETAAKGMTVPEFPYGAKMGASSPEATENVNKLADLRKWREQVISGAGRSADAGDVANIRKEIKALEESAPVADKESIKELAQALQKGNKMKFKDAYSEAEKRLTEQVASHEAKLERLNNQLEVNRSASMYGQELADIDRQIAALEKSNLRSEGRLNPIVEAIRRTEMNTVIARDNPVAPAKIIQQANPEQARVIHKGIVASTDDEFAKAMYGTTRTQAILSDVMPQVSTESGRVTTKVPDISKEVRADAKAPDFLKQELHNDGRIDLSPREKEVARKKVESEFKSISDFHMNEAMSSFGLEGGRIKISAVYGTSEGGFVNAEEAVRKAKYYLKRYGVRDDEITILRKDGIDHVPVKMSDVAGKEGNYLVKVDTYHGIDPTDIGRLDTSDVKLNFFDRLPVLISDSWGSLSKFFFDGSSMLDKIYTGAASRAADRAAGFNKILIEEADKFAKQFKALPKERQAKIDDYLRKANFEELPYDRTALRSEGFNDVEMDAIKSWRDYWDGVYYLENWDLIKTLRSEGYMVLDKDGTKLYAKPVAKNKNLENIYDDAHGAVSNVSSDFLDELYANNGYIAKLRRPVEMEGKTVEHIVVRNNPDEYLRGIRDSDSVLNYRDGYYQITYQKNARFIDEYAADGTRRTVAVAGDTTEAEIFKVDLESANPDKTYKVRGDTRALKQSDDTYWDLNTAQGRIAQRTRGTPLQDGGAVRHLGDHNQYITNPVESAIKAADSISGRTVSRDMFNTMKERWMQQYGDFIEAKEGLKQFPSSVRDIKDRGMPTTSKIADARTVWEHINYLENGYHNHIEHIYKFGMNTMANLMGNLQKAGFKTAAAERGLYRMSEASPVSLAKNLTFHAYIGLNPLRQIIIQTHQAARILSYNPKGAISSFQSASEYLMHKMGTLKNPSEEQMKFFKFIDDSGMLSAVDRHNLVRGALNDMAFGESKITNALKAPIRAARTIGFNAGEQGNLIAHLSAVYDKYKRAGKNLDDLHVRDTAYSEARAISYDMNYAGDMSYNQNFMNVALQFMQVPHKAILQATNRRIPANVRAAMVATDMVLWGTPIALIGNLIGKDVLPDSKVAREILTDGIESYFINKFVAGMTGSEDGNIDMSSLAPYGIDGWKQFYLGVMESGLSTVLTNSPAGNLFLKEEGRVRTAAKSLGRFFGIVDEVDPKGTSFGTALNDIASIASGWANWQKAAIMLEQGKAIDKAGNVIDDNLNAYNHLAQRFGFGTKNTKEYYEFVKNVNKKSKEYKEDVLRSYEDIKRYYYNKLGTEGTDVNFHTAVTGSIMKIYGNDPLALEIIHSKMREDFMSKDDKLFRMFMKAYQIPDPSNLRDDIKRSPVSEEDKAKMLRIVDDIQSTRKERKGETHR